MKFKLTYSVFGTGFVFETESVADLYTATCSIIKREASVAFPRTNETFCDYLQICAQLASGALLAHENHIFKIEALKEA